MAIQKVFCCFETAAPESKISSQWSQICSAELKILSIFENQNVE